MSQYIRLKRKSQTIFLHVEPSNNFGLIKQRIAEILSMPDPSKIMLIGPDRKKELVDLASISDQEIKTDDVIYMAFAKEIGGGYEEIQVDNFAGIGEEGHNSMSSHAP